MLSTNHSCLTQNNYLYIKCFSVVILGLCKYSNERWSDNCIEIITHQTLIHCCYNVGPALQTGVYRLVSAGKIIYGICAYNYSLKTILNSFSKKCLWDTISNNIIDQCKLPISLICTQDRLMSWNKQGNNIISSIEWITLMNECDFRPE